MTVPRRPQECPADCSCDAWGRDCPSDAWDRLYGSLPPPQEQRGPA